MNWQQSAAGLALLVATGCGGAKSPHVLNADSWTVERVSGQPALPGLRLTAKFGADGRLSGWAGCNNYTGEYTYSAAAKKMRVGSISRTFSSCVPTEVMEQEKRFLAVLRTAAAWDIKRRRLTLTAADGSEAAVLIRD